MPEAVRMLRLGFVRCFVFQAEDGIRDLVRSRGLGDVYKRQGQLVRLLLPAAEHQPGDGDPELPVFLQLVDDIALSLIHI